MTTIYILHAPLPDLFKVGYSNDVAQRLDRLRRYCPCMLELVAQLPLTVTTQRQEGLRAERRFHERYLPYRAHHEWFHRNPLLIGDIGAIKDGSFDLASLPTDLSEASLLRFIHRGPRTPAAPDPTPALNSSGAMV